MASQSLETLLETLASSGVEFVVVGMLAAVAQGAPVTTHDLDIVHRTTPENIARLVDVLVNKLDAQTNAGPLDVLGAIEGGRDYDALVATSRKLDISGHTVYVLDLATIVELKRGSTRPKDQLALRVLEETLRLREK